MSHQIYANARTAPKVREEIKNSALPTKELMVRYSISKATVLKWRKRTKFEDLSHRAHTLYTTLTSAQEVLVTQLRQTLLLPLDDLFEVTRRLINPQASRSGIMRLLKRENLNDLRLLRQAQEPNTVEGQPQKKTFKDYAVGFVHIDIKYLPQMPDETSRSYLFVAIDRATRWVFAKVYSDQTEKSSVDFLACLQTACPFKIRTILTDNGSQSTDHFTSKKKEPSGEHTFDRACSNVCIEHRLIPPRHPQTNGMVERFNGRISEVFQHTRFASAAEMKQTIQDYLKVYNHHIPQRNLGHLSPVQALKNWRKKHPELFIKQVYNQAGLDN